MDKHPFDLSPEELQDASTGLTLGIKIARRFADEARQRLCEHKAKSYDEYLQMYHRVEVCESLLADLTHLKDKGKDPLK